MASAGAAKALLQYSGVAARFHFTSASTATPTSCVPFGSKRVQRVDHGLLNPAFQMIGQGQLLQRFSDNHEAFLEAIAGLSEAAFMHCEKGKWTPGQHRKHIALVLEKFRKPLSAKAYIRKKFGALPRAVWNAQTIFQNYRQTRRKAPESVTPDPVTFAEKEALIFGVRKAVSGITTDLAVYSEGELDPLTLPHLLPGLLSIREWMYVFHFHPLLYLQAFWSIARRSHTPGI